MILPADSAQYPEIVELVTAVYVGEGYTDAEIGRRMFVPTELRRRGDILVAVTAEREIIGTVILAEPTSPLRQIAHEGEAEVQLLAVHARFRANGLGAALMEACHERARSKGYSKIVLSTQPAMGAAQRLYERLGYRRNASRDWQARGRQFLVYEKSLAGGKLA
ncbi:MAG: GNAT family N-acetyltransferase [Sulfurifustis sp.]